MELKAGAGGRGRNFGVGVGGGKDGGEGGGGEGYLAVANIYSDDRCSPPLQKAISKPPCRKAGIQTPKA